MTNVRYKNNWIYGVCVYVRLVREINSQRGKCFFDEIRAMTMHVKLNALVIESMTILFTK